MFKTTSFLVLSLLTFGCENTTQVRREAPAVAEPTDAPSSLQAAHDAYLAADFVGTGEAVRDVLLDPSSGSLAKENAFELLDGAYEATHGNLPSRFTLPAGFVGLTVGAQRGASKFSVWRGMYLWMRVKEGMGAKIDEISLLAGDGTSIFTTGAANTTLRLKHVEPGFDDVVLNFDKLDALPPDGVYTIHIGFEGKRVIDTWVITRHLEASASPAITAPGEQVTEANPTVKLVPFRSPENAPFEFRALSVYVEDSSTHTEKFSLWSPKPDAQKEVRVDKALSPGSYWISVTAQERRSFGPIGMERGAQMGAKFSVVR